MLDKNNKKNLFKLLNRVYKEFYINLNSFSDFLLEFYIHLISYEQVLLIITKKVGVLTAIMNLFIKKINFSKHFYSFSFDRYCYFSNYAFFCKENKLLKKHFLLNLVDIPNKSFFFIEELNKSIYRKMSNLKLGDIDDIVSFIFIYVNNKRKKQFIKVFSNFINHLFEINLFLRVRHSFFKKKYNNYYNIYNLINYNYMLKNKKSYEYFGLRNMTCFFDGYELLSNRWERHLFTWNSNPLYLYFLKLYINKKKKKFFLSILRLLFLWKVAAYYFSELLHEQFVKFGVYSKEVIKYHYRGRLMIVPEQAIQFSSKEEHNNNYARGLLDY